MGSGQTPIVVAGEEIFPAVVSIFCGGFFAKFRTFDSVHIFVRVDCVTSVRSRFCDFAFAP